VLLQWAGVLIMPVGIFGIIISRMRQALLRKELARIAAAPVGAKLHKILPLQVMFCTVKHCHCYVKRQALLPREFAPLAAPPGGAQLHKILLLHVEL
jgi:hypothetical protein